MFFPDEPDFKSSRKIYRELRNNMETIYRANTKQILEDLEKKMVFIVGPRQVGKTFLAREIGKKFENVVFLNYDNIEHRRVIKKMDWSPTTDLLILDELHKMSGWKNFLKGVYDTKEERLKILVTGSARLEIYRGIGDSMVGRFFTHHLLPFSVKELEDTEYDNAQERLIERGGFPEAFLAKTSDGAKKWRMGHIDGLVREDVLDFRKIYDFKAISVVFELLRRKVGSPISYSSIASDVGISPTTVRKYLQIFEALFITFNVTPYSKNIARSLLKEPKIYFFDTGMVIGDDGVIFENFVANSLLKEVKGIRDNSGSDGALKYLRTKNGKEVDFCLVDEYQEIREIVEAKNTDSSLDKNLEYFSTKYNLKASQVVRYLKYDRQISDNIKIVQSEGFMKKLKY